ncbi:MAG: ABC transporter permease [Acidobacteria bacterium]|nr:ABC transporter permease [Acidobacteriota bacterium]
MTLRDLFDATFRTLWAHKTRTFLTMFGIAWGILSITLMVAAGEGLRKGHQIQMETMGKDLIIIFSGRTSMQAGGARAGRRLRWRDTDHLALAAEAADCAHVLPEFARGGLQVRSRFNAGALMVTGSLPPFQHVRSLGIEEGRFYNWLDVEQARRVAFIGSDVRKQLFGDKPALGETITMNGFPYEVIGVLKRKEQNSDYNGRDVSKIFVPISTVVRDFPQPPPSPPHVIDQLLVVPASVEQHDACEFQVRRGLARLHGFDPNDKEAVPVWDTFKEARAFRGMTDGMKIFLGAVGVVTLFLGGIGVMNVMLVAVRERTREIGIRKAIGATRGSIVSQFFAETLIIVFFSGALGLGMAFGLCSVINSMEMPPFFAGLIADWRVTLGSLGLLGLVALLAAVYPATIAASIDPIEALRYEA